MTGSTKIVVSYHFSVVKVLTPFFERAVFYLLSGRLSRFSEMKIPMLFDFLHRLSDFKTYLSCVSDLRRVLNF